VTTDQSVSKPFLTPVRTGSLVYLVSLLGAGAYMPFLYVYFNELGLSGKQVGWLSILPPLMMLLFATAIASQADRRHKRRRYAQIAMAGAAISIFLLGFPTSFGGIAILMLAFAIFTSPIMSLNDGLISRMAQRHHLNFGGMRLWGSLGYAVSAVAFGAVWQKYGFDPMFVTAALFYLPTMWFVGKLEEGPVNTQEKRAPLKLILQNSGTVLLLLASFLAGISNSLFMTFSGIYARSLGGGDLLIGLMVAVGGLAELPTMYYGSRIANRLGKTNTAILSYGLMAAAYLGYILTINANTIPLFSILKGLGYGLWFTVTVRLLIERTPEAWAATAQSLLTICWFGLSPLIAGPLGGWIHDAIGPAAVFGLGIVTLVMGALVLWFARLRGKLD
jgi:MFS transporter, PPP family, 3-phenylpropionic acid transporter